MIAFKLFNTHNQFRVDANLEIILVTLKTILKKNNKNCLALDSKKRRKKNKEIAGFARSHFISKCIYTAYVYLTRLLLLLSQDAALRHQNNQHLQKLTAYEKDCLSDFLLSLFIYFLFFLLKEKKKLTPLKSCLYNNSRRVLMNCLLFLNQTSLLQQADQLLHLFSTTLQSLLHVSAEHMTYPSAAATTRVCSDCV